jgi:hypothetical protein
MRKSLTHTRNKTSPPQQKNPLDSIGISSIMEI